MSALLIMHLIYNKNLHFSKFSLYTNPQSTLRGNVESAEMNRTPLFSSGNVGSRREASVTLVYWRRDSIEIMLQLHFTKDTLPDSVSSDFQTLNKFSEQVRIQYFRQSFCDCSQMCVSAG